MNPPRKKKTNATLPRREAEEGVPQSAVSPIQDHELHGRDEGEQDHPIGQTNAGEARQGQQSGQTEKVTHTEGGAYGIHSNYPICPACLESAYQKANAGGGPPPTGEQWRGTVGRVTYRVRITVPTNLLPSRLVLERLISHVGETEAWEAEWGIK